MGRRRDLPCAVCGQHPEPVEADLPDQPHGVNIFTTEGHYGATAYDAPGGEHLELLICTPCMKAMAERSAIHRVLAAAGDTAEQRFAWGSPEEQALPGLTPWDKVNLANQDRLEECAAIPGMTPGALKRLWEECLDATRDGKRFTGPAAREVPSWEGKPLPGLGSALSLQEWLMKRKRSLAAGFKEQIAATEAAVQEELGRVFDVPAKAVVTGGWPCPESPTRGCIYDGVEDPWHDGCLVCGEPSERL